MALSDVRGMTPKVSAALAREGVTSEEKLLAAGKSAAGRKALAKAIDIPEKELLELLNRADLNRIKGVGVVYSNMLEEVGVDTVKELATRNPENLLAKIKEVDTAKNVATRLPTLEEVAEWVSQAKKLPAGIEY